MKKIRIKITPLDQSVKGAYNKFHNGIESVSLKIYFCNLSGRLFVARSDE